MLEPKKHCSMIYKVYFSLGKVYFDVIGVLSGFFILIKEGR